MAHLQIKITVFTSVLVHPNPCPNAIMNLQPQPGVRPLLTTEYNLISFRKAIITKSLISRAENKKGLKN
jgi:hypothetical protein